MPTTARGIWTPSDTDAVDFTTDLATMAGTIDNALDLYGNALRGTASQRAAFLSTAVDGMLWQDTDGIRMIWRKDGALWVPAVWRWRGTTAQMNSFGANAPDGFEWFSTTDNSDYVRLGGVWRGGGFLLTGPSTTSQSGISGATTLAGLGGSLVVAVAGNYELSLRVRGWGSASGQVVAFKIMSGASTTLVEFTSNSNSGTGVATAFTQSLSTIRGLDAGTYAITVTAQVAAGGGTFTSAPNASSPNTLLVRAASRI